MKKHLYKIGIITFLSITYFFGLNIFAATPDFSILPASGTNLKLYCKYNFNILLNAGGQSYNGFDSTLKFNSGDISITHKSIDPFFTSTTSGSIKDENLYRAYGVRPGGSGTSNLNLTTFLFQSIQNILNTTLNFTNIDGGTIIFNPNTTDDGAVVNSSVSSLDILSGVNDSTYNFLPLPCVIDSNAPSFSNYIPSNINGGNYIQSGQTISILINDRHGSPSANGSGPSPLENNTRRHYRYSGLNTILGNYVQAPINVDNQQGVNSGSIKVTITAPDFPSYGTHILSGSDLNIVEFTGNSTINKWTRDSNIRGFYITFNSPIPYPVEKKIRINISATDNPNENNQVNTGTTQLEFNSPIAPSIVRIEPFTNTFISPKIPEIKFFISDNRAGIDTGNIQFTIPQIMSGGNIILSGYTYSGTDLTISLSGGQSGLGNSGSYVVSFRPKRRFPTNTTINISGIFYDLAGSTGTYNGFFSTRPDCSYFGCFDFLTIDINSTLFNFDGDYLIITGTNPLSKYPYFTGLNNDTIDCGSAFLGSEIKGNINIKDINNQSILGNTYTGRVLYLTGGLNITIEGNKIIVK